MTLVYRSPKLQQLQPEPAPGPTTYSQPLSKSTSSPSAVFTSKISRNLNLEHSEVKVGPGTYFSTEEGNSKQKKINGSAVFQSKIERFRDEKEGKQPQKKQEDEEDDDYKVMRIKIPGKVISNKQKKDIQKELLIPQRLPSIPSQQQSFGYRFDPATSKLVSNDSPKIMFAKKLALKEEDFYFQRVQNTIGKNHKTSFMSKVARSSPEIKHLIQIPNASQYHPEKYGGFGHNKTPTVNLANNHGRFEEPNNFKDKLLLGKLKNQFKEYIQGSEDLNTLEQSRKKQFYDKMEGSPSKKSPEKKQFFLAKESRFREKEIEIKGKQIMNKVEGITTNSKNIEESSVSVKIEPSSNVLPKKEPLGRGEERFKDKGKQNLGPGSYNFQTLGNCGATLLQNQQRFKTVDVSNTPGPGAYSTDPQTKPQREKLQFTRFVCRDRRGGQENRFSSMEDLYQQVGRHMNYLQKMGKEESQTKQSSHDTLRKDSEGKLSSLEQAKVRIRQKIGISEQNMSLGRQSLRIKMKQPKHIHMYEYTAPEPEQIKTGPGRYEIRTTLDKKSFNISPPPTYC